VSDYQRINSSDQNYSSIFLDGYQVPLLVIN